MDVRPAPECVRHLDDAPVQAIVGQAIRYLYQLHDSILKMLCGTISWLFIAGLPHQPSVLTDFSGLH